MPRRLLALIACSALVLVVSSALVGWLPGSSARFPGLFGSAAEGRDNGSTTRNAAVAPGVVAGLVSATVGPADAPMPSAGAAADVRDEALGAYQGAVALAPDRCGLDVSLLAAIGQVESGNLAGHQLDADHRPQPAIVGPPLDGSNGLTAVPDTDGGEWDGDSEWDRAVGPLQFIPGAWRLSGVDIDADGERNPQDIEDAAGAAMVFLCAGGDDLSTASGLRSAIAAYNPAPSYVGLVLAWKAAFVTAGLDSTEAEPPELTAVQFAQVSRNVAVSSDRTAEALDPANPAVIPVYDPDNPGDAGDPSAEPTPHRPPPGVLPPGVPIPGGDPDPGTSPKPGPPGSPSPTPGPGPTPPTDPTPTDPPSRPTPTDPDPGLGVPEPPRPSDPEPSDPPPSEPEPSDPPPSEPEPSNPPPNEPEPSNPPPSEPEPSNPPPNEPEPSNPPNDPEPTSSPEPSNPPPSDPEPSNPGPTSSPEPTSSPSGPGSPSASVSESVSAGRLQ